MGELDMLLGGGGGGGGSFEEFSTLDILIGQAVF